MSDTPRVDANIVQHQVGGIWQDYVHASVARPLERDLAEALADAQRLRACERRLTAMIPLFEEALDALTAIPLESAKLRGVRLDLADRIAELDAVARGRMNALADEQKP